MSTSLENALLTLHISRSQIKATVLSSNRQKWIDSLRDLVANLCSQIATVVQVHEKVFKEGKHNFSDDPASLRRFESLVLVFTKIELMINPLEEDHQKLLTAIRDVLTRIQTAPLSEDIQAEGEAEGRRIKAMTQIILKREWERVKRGA